MSLAQRIAYGLRWLAGYMAPATREQAETWAAGDRQAQYRLNDLFYSNAIYRRRSAGGYLETICERDVCVPCIAGTRIIPAVGVKEIVDLYQNVWPGVWGVGMRVAEKFDDTDVRPELVDAIQKVWRDSGLDTNKAVGIQMTANHGLSGLRIRALAGSDRVQIEFVPACDIDDFEEDDQGNVTAVLLKYRRPMPEYLGEESPRVIDVIERLDRDAFSLKYDEQEQLKGDALKNPFGFCPFVVLRHRKSSVSRWGEWAYCGSEATIHTINWRFSRQDKAVDQNQFPKWFATAGGDKPTNFDMGETTVAYVKSHPDTPPPSLAPLVATLQHEAILKFTLTLRDMLRSRQPEITLNDIQLLSGVSGESLAQVLKPTAKAVEDARPNYDHALIRALQMAVSIGGMMGFTGFESFAKTAEASRAEYLAGALNFTFADRPALPLSVYDKINQVNADTARRTKDIADANALVKLADPQAALELVYPADEAKAILDRKVQTGVIPTEPL
jgi:hypothetical protein